MKIKLNRHFYKKEIIEEALLDFQEACEGKIINEDMEVELRPKEIIPDLEGKFCNYVLGLMKNKNLV